MGEIKLLCPNEGCGKVVTVRTDSLPKSLLSDVYFLPYKYICADCGTVMTVTQLGISSIGKTIGA